MSFQLDTSGAIRLPDSLLTGALRQTITWPDLSPFTQGYIEALFAGSLEAIREDAFQRGLALSRRHSWAQIAFSDFAPEALARIIADCEAMAATEVGEKPFLKGAPYSRFPLASWLQQRDTERAAGAAFWSFRNGVKDAFFNTEPRVISITVLPQVVDAARAFPPLTVQLGDDGKVRFA